ncbi:MAG: ABC transporter ATP-binding protein [Thermodesulfobacteriota bacterium]
MLEIRQIDVYYGDLKALWDVSLSIQEGEMVTLIGANGSGKSTILKTIVGWLRPARGAIEFQGLNLNDKSTWKIVETGISLVPEGRGLFPGMSVMENLQMGAFTGRARKAEKERLKEVFQIFPKLEARKNQPAETLSGGEQQMLAIGRGLMSEPRLMLLDEVSLGLAPLITESLFEVIRQIHRSGVTVCFVEQNAVLALEVADRAYVMDEGRVVRHGDAKALLADKGIQDTYLGAE